MFRRTFLPTLWVVTWITKDIKKDGLQERIELGDRLGAVVLNMPKLGADKVAEEFNMLIAYNEDAANRSSEGTMRLYNEIFNN